MIPCMLGVIRIEEHTKTLAFESRQMDLATIEYSMDYRRSHPSYAFTALFTQLCND